MENIYLQLKIKELIDRRKELLLKLSEKDIILLSAKEIVEINKAVIFESNGIFGISDKNLVESSAGAVLNAYHYKNEKDIRHLGLILFSRIIKNRPFTDGNKRTACISLDLFLDKITSKITYLMINYIYVLLDLQKGIWMRKRLMSFYLKSTRPFWGA